MNKDQSMATRRYIAPLMRNALVILFTLIFAGGLNAAEFDKSTLVGEWSGKAKDGTVVKYTFRKDGSVIWYVDEPDVKRLAPSGFQAKYDLRKKFPNFEIDIYDFVDGRFKGITFRGILQPVGNGKFKMEGKPSNKADRPAEFSKEAIIFTKASD